MNSYSLNTSLACLLAIIATTMFCLTPLNGGEPEEIAPATEKQPGKVYRDPFWPVGFRPPDPEEEQSSAETEAVIDHEKRMEELWNEALSKISIRSVSKARGKDGKPAYTAMINNTMVKEGQILRIRVQDTTFRIRVRSIDMKNGVRLERLKD